jgi:hypothetical protein
MARVTVLKSGGKFVADGEIALTASSKASIEAAGRSVCEAKGRSFPSPAIVRVEEFSGRWRKVAEVVVA